MIKKLTLAMALGLGMTAALAEDLTFGIISTESTQNLKASWEPLLNDMAKKTGFTVKAFFAPDYAGIIEGMRFNKVQVAWHGNKSAMEAVDRANGEVFAQMVNADGTQGYNSLLVTHKDSPLNSLDDVLKDTKSLSFGQGDPNSTSGFLVPGFYVFAKNKIDPKTAFKTVRSANHETNALAAANKQVDFAVTNTETMANIATRQPEKHKDIKILWTSPLIPLDPLVMHKDLPAATKTKIKDFFYSYGQTPSEKAVLMNLNKIAAFKPSTNAQLIPIRELDLFSKRVKLENDANLSAADKTAKLADIDKQLAALKQ